MAVANARLHDERRFRARFLSMVVHNLRAPLAVLQVNSDELHARTQAALESAHTLDPEGLQALSNEMAGGVRRITHLIRDAQRLSEPSGAEETAALDLAGYVTEHLRSLATVARA
jgi:signal transduction histidine kinase